jgi:3-hydroxy-D-aspartate aldolase
MDDVTVIQLPSSALDQLLTPCLVVDVPAASRNIRRCAAFFSGQSAALRPHFKAHKCTTLMRQQLAAGGCAGVACQTSWEALVLARAGFGDILIANQIVDPAALDEVAEAASLARLTVVVDHELQVGLLARAAARRGVPIGALVELDVGAGRCGLPFGDACLVPLAEQITRQEGLSFRGLQAYEGHAVHRDSREVRATLVQQAALQIQHEQARLAAAGFDCEVISGGGTGTYDLAAQAGALTEIQAGSYVLMDGRYGTLDLPFEPALYCVTTVISRRAQRRPQGAHGGVRHARHSGGGGPGDGVVRRARAGEPDGRARRARRRRQGAAHPGSRRSGRQPLRPALRLERNRVHRMGGRWPAALPPARPPGRLTVSP